MSRNLLIGRVKMPFRHLCCWLAVSLTGTSHLSLVFKTVDTSFELFFRDFAEFGQVYHKFSITPPLTKIRIRVLVSKFAMITFKVE